MNKEKDYAKGIKVGGPVQDDKKAIKSYKIKDEKHRAVMNSVASGHMKDGNKMKGTKK